MLSERVPAVQEWLAINCNQRGACKGWFSDKIPTAWAAGHNDKFDKGEK